MSSNNSNPNPSTLQSYIDSATGTIQSALGSLTGSTADKSAGQDKKDKAALESDLSHATLKAGPYTGTAAGSGTVTKDSADRTDGSWNQTIGSAKEAVGGLIGSEDLKRAGAQQNADGKAQEARGQLNDLGTGVADRVRGAVGGAVAGLTGDREAQLRAQEQHDRGKTQQRGVEADIQKQNA